MLIEFLGISVVVVIVGSLVALEVAALELRRAFLPVSEDTSGRPRKGAEQIAVSEAVLASRLASCVLLLIAGGLFGRVWVAYLSSRTYSEVVLLPTSVSLVHYLAAVLLGILFVSVVTLVSCLVPVHLARRFPEETLQVLAPLGRGVVWVAWPAMTLGRLLGRVGASQSARDTALEEEAIEEDIKTLVEEGERAGVIEEKEREIISRVFKLGDKPIASLMTPSADVVFLETSMTADRALEVALQARYGWFPVRNGGNREVVGAVSAYDVFEWYRSGGAVEKSLKTLLSNALDVPESMSALELLEQFKAHGSRFAIVRDEYGEVAGVATVHDVLQALVGELGDGDGEARSILTREDGSFLVDAASDVDNLFELLECGERSGGEQSAFHSVGGFVMSSLGQIPKEGDSFMFKGYRFEVLDMDGKRIDKVLVSRAAAKNAVGV